MKGRGDRKVTYSTYHLYPQYYTKHCLWISTANHDFTWVHISPFVTGTMNRTMLASLYMLFLAALLPVLSGAEAVIEGYLPLFGRLLSEDGK